VRSLLQITIARFAELANSSDLQCASKFTSLMKLLPQELMELVAECAIQKYKLSTQSLQALQRVQSVTHLPLTGKVVLDEHVSYLRCGYEHLVSLSLANAGISGMFAVFMWVFMSSDACIPQLAGCPRLTLLDLSGCISISDKAIESLAQLPCAATLSTLYDICDRHYWTLNNQIPYRMPRAASCNTIEGITFEQHTSHSWQNLSVLRALSISRTIITEPFPSLTGLTALDLSSSRLLDNFEQTELSANERMKVWHWRTISHLFSTYCRHYLQWH